MSIPALNAVWKHSRSRLAARLISCHSETLRRLARMGHLPGAYKVGRSWRIRRSAVESLRSGGEHSEATHREGAADAR